jgi:hypothetical protein
MWEESIKHEKDYQERLIFGFGGGAMLVAAAYGGSGG